MSKLFVDKSVEIDAPILMVWKVLTDRDFTAQWAPAFSGDSPLEIESTWRLGEPVLWKDGAGQTIVEGYVTAIDFPRLLRFTAFDVRSQRPAVTEADGITYELSEKGGKTRLHVSQGDFAMMPEGEKYCDMSAEIWARVLSKVKELAEK